MKFSGASMSCSNVWLTPLGPTHVDPQSQSLLNELIYGYDPPHTDEHCLEVELPFLQEILANFTVIPLLTGDIDPHQFAKALIPMIEDNTIVVTSSDLSHYHSYDKARMLDQVSNEAIPALDIERFTAKGHACGKTAILTLMHLAQDLGWHGHFIDYMTSGDTAGDKTQVVGYGAYAFTA
jgi:AmmeMemoRadiSam system protein B